MIREIRRQKRLFFAQTVIVFLAMVVLLIVSGLQVLGATGLALAVGMITFVAVSAQHQVSEARPANAAPLHYADAPELVGLVQELAKRASLQVPPEIYVLNAPLLNAATLGTVKRPLLVVTPMLVRALTYRELAGVLAHEVTHIRHRDLAFFRIVEMVAMITVVVARVGWILLIFYLPAALMTQAHVPITVIAVLAAAPAASVLLQLGLSRSREYAADLGAVELTRDPEGLASALQKIDNVGRSYLHQMLPVPRKRDSSVFRTHPPTDRRVERLRGLRTL
ncbi:MAG: zinc metalloprotease HtpX [Spirochaetaceae bacterium]